MVLKDALRSVQAIAAVECPGRARKQLRLVPPHLLLRDNGDDLTTPPQKLFSFPLDDQQCILRLPLGFGEQSRPAVHPFS